MEQMRVFTIPEIYQKADEYVKSLKEKFEVEFIEIGVLEKGGILILVHHKFEGEQFLGSVRLHHNE